MRPIARRCRSKRAPFRRAGRRTAGGPKGLRGPPLPLAFALWAALPAAPSAGTEPSDLCSGDPCVIEGVHSIEDFSFLDFGDVEVVLNGTLDVGSGFMEISARRFVVNPSGQVRASGGSSDWGGEVSVSVDEDVVIDGAAAAGAFLLTGTDGGTLDITAARGSIRGGGSLDAGATTSDGDGGDIDLTAGGVIALTGEIRANGGCCSDGFGGSGGAVSLQAGGSIAAARIEVRGADGGSLDVFGATSVALGTASARSTGGGGFGGDIAIGFGTPVGGPVAFDLLEVGSGSGDGGSVRIFSEAEVTLGELSAAGGGSTGRGGSVDVRTTRGAIRLPPDTEIRAPGATGLIAGGDGGDLYLAAGSPERPGDLILEGRISLIGRGSDGSGGSAAFGGANVILAGELDLSGSSFASGGGTLDADATALLDLGGSVVAHAGTGGGTLLELSAGSRLSVRGSITADGRGSGSEGGTVILASDGAIDLEPAATVSARGPNALRGAGGDITLRGCTISVASGVPVLADRGSGSIALVARGSMELAGDFAAGPEGSIVLITRDPTRPPSTAGATFAPPASSLLDPLLPPCDSDGDGLDDDLDRCPAIPDPEQRDADGDGVGDVCDNCLLVPNPDQADIDFPEDDDASLPGVQHYGDLCDADLDDDGIVGSADFFSRLRPCLGLDPAHSPAGAEADLDGDGIVGSGDFFGILRPALGHPPGPGWSEADNARAAGSSPAAPSEAPAPKPTAD